MFMLAPPIGPRGRIRRAAVTPTIATCAHVSARAEADDVPGANATSQAAFT